MPAATLWTVGVLAAGLLLSGSLLGSRALRRRLFAGERPPMPCWSGADVMLVLGLTLVGLGAFQLAAFALGIGGEVGHGESSPLGQLLLGVSPELIAVLALVATLRVRTRKLSEALGLGSSDPGRDAGRGLVAYLASYPLVLAAILLWMQTLTRSGVELRPQEVVTILVADQPWPSIAVSMALAVFVIPAIEEMLFRGFLLPTVAQRTGPVAAVLVVGLLFGLLHGWQHAGPTFALGVLLGWLYWRTGSLWVAVGCHGAHNAVMLVTAWLSLS